MITILQVHADHGVNYYIFSSKTKEEHDTKQNELLNRFKGWKEWCDGPVTVKGATWPTDKAIIRMQPVRYHYAWHVSVPVMGTGLEFVDVDPLGGQYKPGKWDIVVEPKEGEMIECSWSDD